jgi:hypothetical protein
VPDHVVTRRRSALAAWSGGRRLVRRGAGSRLRRPRLTRASGMRDGARSWCPGSWGGRRERGRRPEVPPAASGPPAGPARPKRRALDLQEPISAIRAERYPALCVAKAESTERSGPSAFRPRALDATASTAYVIGQARRFFTPATALRPADAAVPSARPGRVGRTTCHCLRQIRALAAVRSGTVGRRVAEGPYSVRE